MGEVLTMAEIEAHYPSEWVLVENPELDENLALVRGKVIAHSKDRDEVDRKAVEIRPKSAASLYTGSMPEDTAIVL